MDEARCSAPQTRSHRLHQPRLARLGHRGRQMHPTAAWSRHKSPISALAGARSTRAHAACVTVASGVRPRASNGEHARTQALSGRAGSPTGLPASGGAARVPPKSLGFSNPNPTASPQVRLLIVWVRPCPRRYAPLLPGITRRRANPRRARARINVCVYRGSPRST